MAGRHGVQVGAEGRQIGQALRDWILLVDHYEAYDALLSGFDFEGKQQLIERARAVRNHDEVYDLEPTHSAQDPRVRRIKRPHLVHPVFDEFMRSPALLAVLSALLGPSGVRLRIDARCAPEGSPCGLSPTGPVKLPRRPGVSV